MRHRRARFAGTVAAVVAGILIGRDVDKGVLADLQAAIIVLAPLLTSATALLLPK